MWLPDTFLIVSQYSVIVMFIVDYVSSSVVMVMLAVQWYSYFILNFFFWLFTVLTWFLCMDLVIL